MTGEKYEWAGAFTAIEAAMTGAANQRSAEFAVSEAERRQAGRCERSLSG